MQSLSIMQNGRMGYLIPIPFLSATCWLFSISAHGVSQATALTGCVLTALFALYLLECFYAFYDEYCEPHQDWVVPILAPFLSLCYGTFIAILSIVLPLGWKVVFVNGTLTSIGTFILIKVIEWGHKRS